MNWIWIQKNMRILVACAIGLSVLLLAIPLWVSMKDRINQQASEAYYKAESKDAFAKVALDFPKSKVARLARIQVANLELKEGAFESAAKSYQALLFELEPKNALRPLVLKGLVSVYEALKTPEKAENYKKELATLGFAEK